nr:hypothetical protein [Tanacetum cinerariifolium]
MNVEMQSMKDNEVWVLVELPPNGKTVGSKWLFKKKTDMDGNVHTYKARLMAKGYTQTPWIDYEETFSPVTDIRAIRILIAIAAMGNTVNELHAMPKLHEQTLPKSNTPALHVIQAGKVQKGNKHKKSQSQTAAKGQNHGKGINKQAYAPKPKIPTPPKKENPTKDSICHECREIGHWKRNCPQYLAELIKKKKNTASGADGSGIFVIELNTILNRSWIYDTACGTYICNTTQGLRASRKLKSGALSFAIPRDGIFEIDLSNSLTNESSIYAISNKRAKLDLDSTLLWHCRLGHISKKRIEKLQHDGLLDSSDVRAFEKYVSCMSGKMERKPYTHQVERAKDLLGLIHTDDHGIIAHRTPSYTSQHNGVSERRNRTLLDMVRSMMNQTTLPKSFWDYVLETVARILNMVPTKKVEKTTYEDTQKTMGYSFYYPPENKVLVAWNAEFLENSLINQEASRKDLEIIQEEDTHPSIDTSLNHEEDDLEIDEPQSDIVPIRRSTRTRHAPDRMCLYIDAEEHELGDLDNEVWVLVELPPNGKTVGSKWLFKKKTDMDGNVHIYKARLVAKGYTQTPGIDYEETFSPVADIKAIRILIAIAAYYEIWQMDVKTSFLNGYLNEEVYMEKPKGFVNPKYPNQKFGFTQNRDESCVYLKASGSNTTFLILYVDDILIMGNSIPMLQSVKTYLGRCFAMKDLGEAAYILGINIYKDRSRRLIGLCQSAYIEKILKRCCMENSKRESIPMQEKLKLSKSQGASTPAELKRMQNIPYASAVGSIMYDMRCTRPDVAISCYIDVEYLTDVDDLKSHTRYVFVLNGGAVDSKSAKQSIFATSSAEAEYIAAFDASKEAVWVRKFIFGLGVVPIIEEPISMYCDNTGAIAIANESGITKGSRHFHAKVHYLREVIEFGDIKLEKVHTNDNLADPFTKALAFSKHSEHTRNIRMLPASACIMESVEKLIKLAAEPQLADMFLILGQWDLQGWYKEIMRIVEQDLCSIWKDILEKKRHGEYIFSDPKDFTDTLIEKGFTNQQINPLLIFSLIPQCTVSNLSTSLPSQEIFAAGTKTTTLTIEWFVVELLINQDTLQKVKDEITQHIHGKVVKDSDLVCLSYLKACYKETLRLHPPTPFLVSHKSLQTCEVMGYTIPKDSQIMVNVWAIIHDSNISDDPFSSKPKRFMGSNMNYTGKDFVYIPFGSGRRMCPGESMASKTILLISASLVRNFDWFLPDNMNPDTMNCYKFGVCVIILDNSLYRVMISHFV